MKLGLVSVIIFIIINAITLTQVRVILEQADNIKFGQTKNYKILSVGVGAKSYLSIRIYSNDFIQTDKSSQIISYINLNKNATADYYLKKTTDVLLKGVTYLNNKYNLYQVDLSPCDFTPNDELYIQIAGVEGNTSYIIQVVEEQLDELEIISCDNTASPDSLYSSSKEEVYRLENQNIYHTVIGKSQWKLVSQNNKKELRPTKRTKNVFQYFNNRIYLYGGITPNNTVLNDFWTFDFDMSSWFRIQLNNSQRKMYGGGSLVTKNGFLVLYGGENKNISSSFYQINLAIAENIIRNNKDKKTKSIFNLSKRKTKYINTALLFKEIPADIKQKFGFNMVELDDDNIMIYGGFESKNVLCKEYSIFNMKEERVILKKVIDANEPEPRSGATLVKFGTILFLQGGVDEFGRPKNDIWKFNIPNRVWIKLPEWPTVSNYHYIGNAFSLPYLHNIISIKDNETYEFKFNLCLSDTEILSSTLCLPCEEGSINKNNQCTQCPVGTYLDFKSPIYSEGKCTSCPEGSYNKYEGGVGIASCRMCPYGTMSNSEGRGACLNCPSKTLCLPGTSNPIPYSTFSEFEDNKNIIFENEPDFFEEEEYYNIDKILKSYSGLIILIIFLLKILFIFFILYKINSTSCNLFFIQADFLPLTGGTEKKASGGMITLTYIVIVFLIIVGFLLKFFLWNDDYDVTTISTSPQSEAYIATAKVDVITSAKYRCSLEEISISPTPEKKINFEEKNGLCSVAFYIEELSKNITIKVNNITHIQMYKVNLSMYWSKEEDEEKGYSRIIGVFGPNSEAVSGLKESIEYSDSFASLSVLNIGLSDIDYHHENYKYSAKKGYRMKVNSFKSGRVVNKYSYLQEKGERGIVLSFHKENSLRVVGRRDINELELFAMLLGIIAGLSFLCRLFKYLFEKFKFMDLTRKNYDALHEELEQPPEMEMPNHMRQQSSAGSQAPFK